MDTRPTTRKSTYRIQDRLLLLDEVIKVSLYHIFCF